MNICLLTTKLNSVWLSMQEIIPSLESQWRRFSNQEGHHIDCILVDDDPTLKTALSKILVADIIIVVAFNHKVAMALRVIREFVGLQSPFVFYLHGQASIGLWPLEEFKVLPLLHQGDIFISTCTKDKSCFDALFENKKAIILPFQIRNHAPVIDPPMLWEPQSGVLDFVFIGRISEQKNLHTLIYAMSLMESKNFRFHVIGGEDHLGSPNMQRESQSYLTVLKKLVTSTGLSERISFYGFLKREQLQSFLKQQHFVFISASLHSDENFGMAALWALCHGARAVLTDWGGHSDFQDHFREQVDLVPVCLGERGPFLEISTLVAALEKQMHRTVESLNFYCPDYYQDQYAFDQLKKITSAEFNRDPLVATRLLARVFEQRSLFKADYLTKIFYDYQDPLAHEFFKAYGAKEESALSGQRKQCLPWVQKRDEIFLVEDPHRGTFVFDDEGDLMKSEFAHF